MGDARPMPDAEVDALAKEVVDWYVEWNPIFATYVGIHDHDHRLPSGTREAELEERGRIKDFLRRLEAIDRKGLSAGKRVDWGNLRNVFRLWIFESEEIGTWQSMPRGAQTVGDALFPLIMRSFAPLPRRLESITGRLERSPEFLKETKGRIRAPIKIWSEISLEATQRLPGFLKVIEATGTEALAGSDRARLEEAVAKTGLALDDYARWIASEVLPKSKDKVGIGAAKFRKLVRLRELGLSVDEIYAVGKKYLRDSKRALVGVANEIKPGASVEEAKEIVKSDHPARFEEAISFTAKVMSDSKAFIRQHDLATIPPNEELTVIETPSYLRHVIPFAAYNAPARFEAHKQGFYMVTPVEDKPEMLREPESVVRPHPGGRDGDGRGLGPLLRGHDEGGRIQRRPGDEARAAPRPDLAGLPNPDRRRLAHGQDDVRRGGRPPGAGGGDGAPRRGRGSETVHLQSGVPAVVPDRQVSHHRAAQRCEEASREGIFGQVVPRHDPVLRFATDEVHAGNLRPQGPGTWPAEEGRVVGGPSTGSGTHHAQPDILISGVSHRARRSWRTDERRELDREEGHGVQGERPLREGDRGRVASVPRDRHLAPDARDQGRRGAEGREDRLAVRWRIREPHRVHGRGDVGHRPRRARETADGCGLDRRRRDQRDSSGGIDQRGAGERAHRLPAQRGAARQRRRVFLELRLSPGQESFDRRRRRLDG